MVAMDARYQIVVYNMGMKRQNSDKVVIDAIITFMENRREFTATTTGLLHSLSAVGDTSSLNWPTSARRLATVLNKAEDVLHTFGIALERRRMRENVIIRLARLGLPTTRLKREFDTPTREL